MWYLSRTQIYIWCHVGAIETFAELSYRGLLKRVFLNDIGNRNGPAPPGSARPSRFVEDKPAV